MNTDAIALARDNDPFIYDNRADHRAVSERGRVVNVTTEGAVEHIEMLAQKYLGTPYPWYGGRDQVRVIIVIAPEKVSSTG